MQKLVSIIIPVYNGANYLRQAIDSSLSQIYCNVEIIVVDDGSDDSGLTESIAKSYGNRINYHRKVNGGVASALNAGIRIANGEYISWLSHDDLYYPDKIERQMNLLATIQSPNVVVYSDYEAIDADNNSIGTIRLKSPEECDSKMAFLYLLFQASVHGCSLLLPKKCFTDVGFFSEDLRGTQDYDLWFKLLKNGYEFRHIPEVLIRSRWHDEQGSRTMYALHQQEIEMLYSGAVDMFYEDLEKFSVETLVQMIINFRNRHVRKTANYMLQTLRSRNRSVYRQMYMRHAKPLLQSYLAPFTSKPGQLFNLVIQILKSRG